MMKILFLNFQFGLMGIKGSWQSLAYWRYLNYPRAVRKVIEFIRNEDIDVAGLTEVNFPKQPELFKKETGMEAAGEKIYWKQGNLLLSWHKIRRSSVIPLPKAGWGQPRALVRADVETSNGLITFLLTHLSLGPLSQKKQITFLNDFCLNLENPFVLMGDFNYRDWRKGLAPLLNNPKMRHVELGPTFPSWKPRRYFDHFFVSKDLKVKEVKIYSREKFSDHLALVAEVVK